MSTELSVLSSDERDELERLERIVENNLPQFRTLGAALVEIRDRRLYRETHPNYAEYLADRWGFTKSHANMMIEGAVVAERIEAAGLEAPSVLAHALAVSKAPPELQPAAVELARENVAPRKPKAKDYAAAVKELAPEPEPEPEYVDADPPDEKPEWERNAPDVDALRVQVNAMIHAVTNAPKVDGWEEVTRRKKSILASLEDAKAAIVACVPYAVCPYCLGLDSECATCNGRGWVTRNDFNAAPAAKRKGIVPVSLSRKDS